MKRNLSLPVLTLGHFLIDLACLYFLFSHYPQGDVVAGIQTALLYNFLAFALQAVIGYFFDRFPARRSTSIGILSVLCGYLCGFCKFPAAGLILCGIGNSFYHVGGSIGIAGTDRRVLRSSGIFVSSGALGVSLGIHLAAESHSAAVWILLLLIALLLLQTLVVSSFETTTTELSADTGTILLVLSLVAVLIRSLGGLFFPASYRTLFTLPTDSTTAVLLLAMASGVTAFLGKFLGGFLSISCTNLLHKSKRFKNIDIRTGNYLFGAITLLCSALLLTIWGNIPALCFLGILCFHAAMPVTLFELYCILPDRPGFAMGLSTLMLFLGYLPTAFVPPDKLPARLILCVLTLLAAGCMAASLLIYQKAVHQKKQPHCKGSRKQP